MILNNKVSVEGCCRCTSSKYIIMKVISFNDSSIQAYRLGKALLTYTNCVVGVPMYTKGLVLRIEGQYNSFYILLFLYNSHKESSVLYQMHAHTCVQK